MQPPQITRQRFTKQKAEAMIGRGVRIIDETEFRKML